MTQDSRSNVSAFWDQRCREFGHTGWSDQFIYRYDQPLRLRAVARVIRRVGIAIDAKTRVLDVGCGTGELTIELARRGAEVVGIDISREVVAKARVRCEGLPGISLISTGIEEFNYPSDSFDLISSVTVLQHLTDRSLFILGMRRICSVLRPGGHLLLLELAPVRADRVRQQDHIIVRTRAEWIVILRDMGLELVEDCSFPQLAIALLSILGRVARRGAVSPANDGARVFRLRPSWRRIASRLIVALSFPFDHLLAIPTPGWLAPYRILVFQRAVGMASSTR